jgi:hypothetical protein
VKIRDIQIGDHVMVQPDDWVLESVDPEETKRGTVKAIKWNMAKIALVNGKQEWVTLKRLTKMSI